MIDSFPTSIILDLGTEIKLLFFLGKSDTYYLEMIAERFTDEAPRADATGLPLTTGLCPPTDEAFKVLNGDFAALFSASLT